MSTSTSPVRRPQRFYGRVKLFWPHKNCGYIVELGECGTNSTRDLVEAGDVYFRTDDFSIKEENGRFIARKSTVGEIVEYERVTDEQGRHRAFVITGLMGTKLQCEEGVLTFKTYEAVHKDYLYQQGLAVKDHYARAYGRGRGGGGSGGRGRGRGRGYHYQNPNERRHQRRSGYNGAGQYRNQAPPTRRSRSRSRSRDREDNEQRQDVTHVDIPRDDYEEDVFDEDHNE